MTAEIITIGDEILIGQIVDTNSVFIAKELNKIGISVNQITSIQDNREHILSTLKDANLRADLVIITGGLGPTKDDITKHTFCEYFEDHLVKDQSVLDHIENLFEKIVSTPISDMNRDQAMVLSKSTVLFNKYGTAPGIWIEKDKTVFVAMPGVPFEMKSLMEYEVIPKLISDFNRPFIYHKTIRTYGLGESAIAQRIEAWEEALPAHIKLAYLPSYGSVRLRLSGKGDNEEKLKESIEVEFEKIYPLLEDILPSKDGEDQDIAMSINNLLASKQQSLCFAESCTGGELAAAFTLNPGASRCFKGGLVTYATKMKEDILNVPANIIEKYSVVSGEVAEKMAENAKKLFNSDYAISTTGNAGPAKGDSDVEIGTVFIGVATPDRVFSVEYQLGKNREQVVNKAVNKAFELLLKELNHN
ncbi:nicotinamide-nucleotide amidase [Gillisia sp. Hel1_33_143]|uniref:competence/damage-inducible protein A n=1 Tax=Gillisia sp. Hel1_33_143 TaxID=1336796 RepID=UPI00087BFF44|nr:competence/damage-inducible protein A [Gillisia sp. Hel1_33_143]SDS30661.1 nicotinamide-nucleotide amidase [Gillisia sp. Hel1_33_143]